MNTINLWRKFIEEPTNIQEETKNGVILIMLTENIRPKSVYSIISALNKVPSREKLEELGYAFSDDGKLKRTSRFFWSKDMQAIKDWADLHKITFSCDIKGDACLSADGLLLQLRGKYGKEAWEKFPVEYEYVQAHPIKF